MWPDVTTERFRFDGGENGRHVEFLRHFGKKRDIVNKHGAIRIRHAEEHLRLGSTGHGSQCMFTAQLWMRRK